MEAAVNTDTGVKYMFWGREQLQQLADSGSGLRLFLSATRAKFFLHGTKKGSLGCLVDEQVPVGVEVGVEVEDEYTDMDTPSIKTRLNRLPVLL